MEMPEKWENLYSYYVDVVKSPGSDQVKALHLMKEMAEALEFLIESDGDSPERNYMEAKYKAFPILKKFKEWK